MNSKLAKKLRRIAKTNTQASEIPSEDYTRFINPKAHIRQIRLTPGCEKQYYRQLKQLTKQATQ